LRQSCPRSPWERLNSNLPAGKAGEYQPEHVHTVHCQLEVSLPRLKVPTLLHTTTLFIHVTVTPRKTFSPFFSVLVTPLVERLPSDRISGGFGVYCTSDHFFGPSRGHVEQQTDGASQAVHKLTTATVTGLSY
jgi:hypothetical protein